MRRQIAGMGPGHARHRHLGEVVEGRDAIVVLVVLRGAVRHLHQQAAGPGDQQRQGVVGGDEMGVDRQVEHVQPLRQVVLPHRAVPLDQTIGTPDVVDQDVEAPLLGPDAGDECRDLVRHQMVDANRDADAAGGLDQFRRLLDRLGPGALGRAVAGGAPGDIDRGARRPSSTAMPRPAPRVPPATRATFPARRIAPSSVNVFINDRSVILD